MRLPVLNSKRPGGLLGRSLGSMSLEDSPELREQLSQAWRGLTERLLQSRHPPAAVAETMLDVAVEQLVAVHGSTAGANYLRLLADQMIATEKDRVRSLLHG